MKKINIYLICLVFIIVLAAGLRLWRLGEVPISPDWDEVSLGYNAYSIAQTGRDEYGRLLPFVLRSYNDYKPALYSYLIIPFLSFFDLGVLAVRLPSALFGIAAVIATYFFVMELCKRKDIALLSTFFLAISPWHIQFSRVAFESSVGMALNLFVGLFFLKGLKKPWLLSIAALFAGLSIYIYQSEKIFTPLLVIALVIIYHKKLISLPKKALITAFFIGLVVVLPMLLYLGTHKQAFQRAEATSIFANTELTRIANQRIEDDLKNHDVLGLVIDTKVVVYSKIVIANYVSHSNLNWLFITGDASRHHPPGMGLLYFFEFPFLCLGIYFLLFYKNALFVSKQSVLVLFVWFLLAPVPASITNDVPHAVRTLNFLPIFQIFIAVGFWFFNKILSMKVKNFTLKASIFFILGIVGLFNFSYYYNQYFVQYNYFNAQDWQYGYAKLIPEVQKIVHNYDTVIVSDKQPMDESYMFFLFYLTYSPKKYQAETKTSADFIAERGFDKYHFRKINWQYENRTSKTLFIGVPEDFPKDIKTLKTIYYPDGEPAMKIIGT